MNTHTLGEPRFASTLSHTISDDVRIPERIEIGAEPGIKFELAGPRAKLFFTSHSTEDTIDFVSSAGAFRRANKRRVTKKRIECQ